jgi:hypothetical protein
VSAASWGDFVLAFTAITAAAIAAWTANRRMRHQLEHDRAMRVADELRAVIDDAETAIGEAAEAIGHVYEINGGQRVQSLPNATLDEAVSIAQQKTLSLGTHWQRLMLRFNRTHDIPGKYWETREAFWAALSPFGTAQGILDDPGLDESKTAYHESASRNVAFVDACAEFVSVLDDTTGHG